MIIGDVSLWPFENSRDFPKAEIKPSDQVDQVDQIVQVIKDLVVKIQENKATTPLGFVGNFIKGTFLNLTPIKKLALALFSPIIIPIALISFFILLGIKLILDIKKG